MRSKLIYESEDVVAKPQPPLRPMANVATVTFRGRHERRVMRFEDALRRALSQMKAEAARAR